MTVEWESENFLKVYDGWKIYERKQSGVIFYDLSCLWIFVSDTHTLQFVHIKHVGVPRRQPHRRSGLATLPSVGAIP